MVEGLDMSLEDIINKNKNSAAAGGSRSSRGGRGRGGSSDSGVGPTRRFDNKVPPRTNPYAAAPHPPPSVSYAPPQALHVPQMMVGRPPTNSEAGTKLYISNLDYEVTNEDIKVLFSDVGELKRYSIHYDRSGRSKGTAEVVYVRHPDAVAAMKRYNNMQLDGKPMRLELVGVNIVTPVPIPPVHHGIRGNPMVSSQSTQGRIVGRGQDRGGDNAQRGSGRGRARPQKVSAEDLDADLEKYRLERMHIK
ncbi:nucleotide-binding alpha-beta plait domain-containing protein [Artemisia annua]|uniref:Nucleotide-binding alpha-beta plait domain-containing protein n=1 Tax=Artemisia annua TaxID=35608 RepID=A0A2U1PXI7_ARTAN|nr:nucleotide-binding alpha-beta plait domain-containing protein [Artemisia annua]